MLASRGAMFEGEVERILDHARSVCQAAGREFDYTSQPNLPLLSGDMRRPDFHVRYTTHAGRHEHLIECQSRDRIKAAEIRPRIAELKALSAHNRVIFVHDGNADRSVVESLGRSGVRVLTVPELVAWLVGVLGDMSLAPTKIGEFLVYCLPGASVADVPRHWRDNRDGESDQAMLSGS